MSRAEALRDLLAHGEAGRFPEPAQVPLDLWVWPSEGFMGHAVDAFDGSLDAVARLEAPLRERGWRLPVLSPPERQNGGNPHWMVRMSAPWIPGGRPRKFAVNAPTEARTRLLAVLRALLHEAEQAP